MKKPDLYKEGARLPEQLSRLLFLEGMVAGRRVLEVNASSSAVARFLLDLGAARVVCAVDPAAGLLDGLRAKNDLDRVDFRAIRNPPGSRPPGTGSVPVLPGDDGAFDLVIDFSLPQALARGETWRLTDIARVLSDDGFALTSLSSTPTLGLPTLLDPQTRVAPAPVPGYRAVVDALKGNFELVQVYFQSLLLGYLFGSFDHEPGDDGIAPQTHLMGDEPEPAGSYLFAFGNAVPVIEDVCLVQVPFDALLQAFLDRRGARNFEDRTEQYVPSTLNKAPVVAPRPLPPLADSSTTPAPSSPLPSDEAAQTLAVDDDDDDTQPLAAAVVVVRSNDTERLELALAEREAVILELRTALAEVNAEIARADAEGDPAATLLPTEADVVGLAKELDDAAARVMVVEAALAVTRAELERVVLARDAMALELRADRDALAEQLVALDRERSDLVRQVRQLDDERELLGLRAQELEEAAVAASVERAHLQSELLDVQTRAEGERQRQRVEREMLDATLAAHAAQVHDLEQSLSNADVAVQETREHLQARIARAEEETKTVQARLKASQVDADAALVARAKDAEAAQAVLEERVRVLEAALEEAAVVVKARLEAAEAGVADAVARLQQELDAAVARASSSEARALAVDDERTALRERVASLEGDAVRLADGVKALIEERAHLAAQLGQVSEGSAERELQLAREKLRADDAERAARDARAALEGADHAAVAEVEKLAEKRRADQRIIEELRARLQETRAAVDDVTAQRQVVQQALAAREAELHERRAEQSRLQQELDRKTNELVEQQKKAADVDGAANALSVEVRRLNGLLKDSAEEQGKRIHDLTVQRDEALTLAEQLDEKRRVAEAEALKALEDVESERARAQRAASVEIEQLHKAFAEEKARLLRELEGEKEILRAALLEEHTGTTKLAVNEAIAMGEELLARRLQVVADDEAAARALLEERFARERTDLEARLQAARDEVARVRADADADAAALRAELHQAFDDERARLRAAADEDVRRAQRSVDEESKARAAAEAERARLQGELEATRDELAHHTESLLALEERAENIEGERARAQEQLEHLRHERGELERALAADRAELAAAQARLADVEATAADAVNALANEIKVARDDAANAYHALSADLDVAKAHALDGAARIGDLESALKDTTARLEDTEARLKDAEARVVAGDAATGKAIADLDVAKKQLTRGQAILDERTAALAVLQARVDAADASLAELLSERDALSNRAAMAEGEVEAISAKLAASEGAFVDADDQLKRALRDFEALGQAKADELAALSARVDDVSVELTAANELLAERERALEDSRARVIKAEERATELEAQLDQGRRAYDELGQGKSDELGRLQAQLDEQLVEVTRSNELLGERERAFEDTRNKLIESEQRVRDYDAERARLEKILVDNAAELTLVQRGLDIAVEEKKRAQQEADDLRGAADAARAAVADELRRARDRSGALESEGETTRASLKDAEDNIRDLRDKLGDAAKLQKELQARVDDNDSVIAGLRAQVTRLTAQHDLVDAALAEARSLLSVERARGDLFHDELQEASETLVREHARGELFRADLEEAQLALGRLRAQLKDVREHGVEVQETLENISKSAEGEAVRADELTDQLDEAQRMLETERLRGEQLQVQLDDAQKAAAKAAARAAELSGQLDDAQETFLLRRAAHQSDLDRLIGHRLAEKQATERQLNDLRAAVADGDADRAALAARLKVAEEAHAALANKIEGSAELQALNESLRTEIEGLKSSLEMAREDAIEVQNVEREAAMEAKEQLMLVTAERDRLQENAALDLQARDSAQDERDAAVADLKAAQESAKLEARRRADLEAELLRLHAEHAAALEKAAAGSVDDTAELKAKLEALDKASKAKDAKIAEQAERINRLTERIVRTEGLA